MMISPFSQREYRETMKDCAPPRSRVAGGKMPQQRQGGDDDDNTCDEEWSMEHPGLSSLSNKGFHYHHLRDDGEARDHHSHSSQTATATTAGTDRRGSFGGSSSGNSTTNAPATDDTSVVAITSIMKEMKANGFGGHDMERRVIHFADDSKNDNANQSSSPSLISFTADRPGFLPQDHHHQQQQQPKRCGDSPPSYSYTNGDNRGGGDYSSPGVYSPILKKTSTSVTNNMMTISQNTTIDRPSHQATMQFYYPPPPYGKTAATSLSSPIGTTTTNSSISPPPPPPRSTTSSSQEKKMISLPPPPPPVWPIRSSRRSSTSTLSASSNDAVDEVVISSTPSHSFFLASSSLFCSVINDTIHHKNSDSNNMCCNSKPKKKEVTFASSTTGGMTATCTMNTIDTGAPTTATTVAKKVSTTDDSGSSSRNSDYNNKFIHRNGGSRRDSVEEQNRKTFKEEDSPSMVNLDEQQMRRKTTAHKYQNEMYNNIITNSNKSTKTKSNHGNNTAPTIQIGKKSTTTAIASNTTTAPHHSSSSSAKNRDLLKRVSTVCDSVYTYLEEFDSRNYNKSLTNPTRVGTNKDRNNNSNAEHDNYTRQHTTENNTIHGICKTEEHDQKKDLSFTPGSNKFSSPLVYSRRHSTGNSVPRQHSTSSAKMSITSPISTATTSRMTAATSNRRDGGSLKSRTKGSSTADSSNDRSFSDVPSPPDLKSSLQSVVRGRQRISRIHSSSHCTTIADTVAPSSAITPPLQQQPKQQQRQRQYLRSTSMDGSAYSEERRGERRHNLHRRSRSTSSKFIVDNLTKQVNTNRRNFHRSSSEGDSDDTRMNSLLTTKSLLQQLRTSLDDAVAARRGFIRSGKEHVHHQKLINFTAAATTTSTPSGQKTDCDGEGVIATVKNASVDNNVARQDRCNSMKDSSKSSTPSLSATANGGYLPKRAVVGRGQRGSGCSSTESLSAADTNSDCESLISVLRSYRGEESKGEEGLCERKMRRKKLLDVGGLALRGHRRRGSSLSRNAAQVLSTVDSPGRDCGEDSKASMVYDIPFDPITGKCHHHSMVQMAVREDDDDNEKKKQGGISFATTSSDSTVLFGWRIVRTTCPKCKYNY